MLHHTNDLGLRAKDIANKMADDMQNETEDGRKLGMQIPFAQWQEIYCQVLREFHTS